eukprot:Pgem_evm2s19898
MTADTMPPRTLEIPVMIQVDDAPPSAQPTPLRRQKSIMKKISNTYKHKKRQNTNTNSEESLLNVDYSNKQTEEKQSNSEQNILHIDDLEDLQLEVLTDFLNASNSQSTASSPIARRKKPLNVDNKKQKALKRLSLNSNIDSEAFSNDIDVGSKNSETDKKKRRMSINVSDYLRSKSQDLQTQNQTQKQKQVEEQITVPLSKQSLKVENDDIDGDSENSETDKKKRRLSINVSGYLRSKSQDLQTQKQTQKQTQVEGQIMVPLSKQSLKVENDDINVDSENSETDKKKRRLSINVPLSKQSLKVENDDINVDSENSETDKKKRRLSINVSGYLRSKSQDLQTQKQTQKQTQVEEQITVPLSKQSLKFENDDVDVESENSETDKKKRRLSINQKARKRFSLNLSNSYDNVENYNVPCCEKLGKRLNDDNSVEYTNTSCSNTKKNKLKGAVSNPETSPTKISLTPTSSSTEKKAKKTKQSKNSKEAQHQKYTENNDESVYFEFYIDLSDFELPVEQSKSNIDNSETITNNLSNVSVKVLANKPEPSMDEVYNYFRFIELPFFSEF